MTKGPSPTEYIGGIVADQSSKMAATIIASNGVYDYCMHITMTLDITWTRTGLQDATLQLILTGPDSSSGRASAPGAVGHGFESQPCHTKGVNNGITLALKG